MAESYLPRLRSTVRRCNPSRWAGLAGLLLLYAVGLALHTFVRGHADDLGRSSSSGADLDSLIFHGLPPVWLQRWTPDSAAIRSLAVLFHASILFLPAVFMCVVCLRLGRRATMEVILLQLAVFFSADVVYTLYPTRPPWMDVGVVRIIALAYGHKASIDDNVTASIPSLHVAIPMLFTLWSAHQRDNVFRRLSVLLGVWTLGVAWAVVYGGEHYMIGVIAGAAWATAVFMAFLLVTTTRSKLVHRPGMKAQARYAGRIPSGFLAEE